MSHWIPSFPLESKGLVSSSGFLERIGYCMPAKKQMLKDFPRPQNLARGLGPGPGPGAQARGPGARGPGARGPDPKPRGVGGGGGLQ